MKKIVLRVDRVSTSPKMREVKLSKRTSHRGWMIVDYREAES